MVSNRWGRTNRFSFHSSYVYWRHLFLKTLLLNYYERVSQEIIKQFFEQLVWVRWLRNNRLRERIMPSNVECTLISSSELEARSTSNPCSSSQMRLWASAWYASWSDASTNMNTSDSPLSKWAEKWVWKLKLLEPIATAMMDSPLRNDSHSGNPILTSFWSASRNDKSPSKKTAFCDDRQTLSSQMLGWGLSSHMKIDETY